MISFSGSVWRKAVFIIQAEVAFVCYLHLYPEDTDLPRQIVLKNLNMSISCLSRPNMRDMEAISHPVRTIKSRSTSLSDYSLLAQT